MQPIRTTATASLTNPNDPTELTLIADAVGVGTTYRMASGHIITWTADFLRAKAHSFIGKPVNIDLDENGRATSHSRRVVGAITHAFFDERKQAVTVHAAIWPHYAPATVARIKELAQDDSANRTQVSMEFIPTAEMTANSDGSQSPTEGEFSGLGIVGVGADPRNRLILVAAIAEDEAAEGQMPTLDSILDSVRDRFGLTEPITPEQALEARAAELSAAHEGSFEWFGRRVAEWLSSRQRPDEYTWASVIATYPKHAIYQEGENFYKVAFTRKGRDIEFSEPVEVDPTYNELDAATSWAGVEVSASQDDAEQLSQQEDAGLATEATEELKASVRAELLAELQPDLDELATLRTEKTEREATELKAATANTRVEELERILPAKDDQERAKRVEQVIDLPDAGFEALKAAFIGLAEVHGGLNSDAEAAAAKDDEAETPDPVQAAADQIIQDMEAREAAAKTPQEK